MSAIRRADRGNEWWVDFRHRGRRVRRRSTTQSKRGTEQYERFLRERIAKDDAQGRNPFIKAPAFGEFANQWMRDYVLVYNRLSGQREKRWCLNSHLLPEFSGVRLDEITTASVDTLTRTLATRGLAPKSVNNVLTVLRCMLRTAQEWGLLGNVPRIRQVRVPERPVRYLEPSELDRLTRAAPSVFWSCFMTFLAHTGLRFGEAAALLWEDVHFDDRFPRIEIHQAADRGIIAQTKTGRVRVVPMTATAIGALSQLPRVHPLVFPMVSGEIMQPGSTVKVLYRTCDRAGIPRIGWHGLRHSYATALCQRGAPLRDVQELLGHSSITMTCRYAHAHPENLKHWVDKCFGDEARPSRDQSGHQVATSHGLTAGAKSARRKRFAQRSAKSRREAGFAMVDLTGLEPVAEPPHE